jgi:nitrogen fixation/metabolism regulation signal transduction histidine kinase
MSIRILLIALFLIPINSLWLMTASLWGAGYPTTVSLFFNAIFFLFILVLLNQLIKRISPRRALSKRELLGNRMGRAFSAVYSVLAGSFGSTCA